MRYHQGLTEPYDVSELHMIVDKINDLKTVGLKPAPLPPKRKDTLHENTN